jgi:cytochrome c oxidase assembly protein subunit 15
MVKSGLVNDPHVSQYRLTAHLGLAVVIYAFMLWTAFGLLYPQSGMSEVKKSLSNYSYAITGLLFLMILSGGLVAGTKAGYAYSTFPLMGDSFIPAGLYATTPAWLAAFENITTIQFNHRIFAYLLFILIIDFGFKTFREKVTGRTRRGVHFLLACLLLQVGLGISTILSHVAVPIAAAHQGGAILLLTSALFVCHQLRHSGSAAATQGDVCNG